jgi:hypothetical protein
MRERVFEQLLPEAPCLAWLPARILMPCQATINHSFQEAAVQLRHGCWVWGFVGAKWRLAKHCCDWQCGGLLGTNLD